MPTLRFGGFELDTDSRRLRRDGLRVPLAPQPFELLIALLESPGQVVEREEIRRRLWGAGTHVCFDRGLNFCVNRLRRALGDEARRPRFVETVPGRGYRFVGALGPVASPARVARDGPIAPGVGRAQRAARLAALALLALLVFAGRDRTPARDALAEALLERARTLCGDEGWRASIPLLAAAVARDPDYAAAHAVLARSYLELGTSGGLDPDQAYPAARDAARRALAIEERPDARLALGEALLAYDWDWTGAEREIRRALELAPRSGEAWRLLARLASSRGAHAVALDAARRAESLAPSSIRVLEEAAFCHYRARRYAEAERRFRRLAARRPEEAHHRLFAIHRLVGRDAAALAEAHEVMRLAGVSRNAIEALGRHGAASASAAYLRGSLDQLQRESGSQRVAPERVALLWAALGERSEALLWLSRAADERSPDLAATLQDPLLDSLRREPRFVDLLLRVGVAAA